MPRGPINLITNNFKIKSQNHGIIYTYTVDFIDGETTATAESNSEQANPDATQLADGMAKMSLEEESKQNNPRALVRDLAVENLETFQKYKILGAQAAKLKSIFVNYISVGNNIFSTSMIDDKIDFETKQAYFGRKFTIRIERVSEFALDDLNTMKMEEHPFALSFINSIIKTQMRNSKLCQIGRNPRFFMPS